MTEVDHEVADTPEEVVLIDIPLGSAAIWYVRIGILIGGNVLGKVIVKEGGKAELTDDRKAYEPGGCENGRWDSGVADNLGIIIRNDWSRNEVSSIEVA